MAIYNGHNEDSSGNLLLSIGNGMTATVETGTTASQAYTKGSYVFFDNKLCKTTKAISSGATLTIGNNLSQTSLGEELTSHLRSSDGKEFYFDVKNGTYGYYPSASKTSSEFVPFGGTSLESADYAAWVILYNGYTATFYYSSKPSKIVIVLANSPTNMFLIWENGTTKVYQTNQTNTSGAEPAYGTCGKPTERTNPFTLTVTNTYARINNPTGQNINACFLAWK